MTTSVFGDDRGVPAGSPRTSLSRLDAGSEGASRHGIDEPRGQDPEDQARGGRFGRMFPYLPARDPGAQPIEKLVEAMAARNESGEGPPNTRVPAGYTYLGQFIDHDITFDPTSRFGHDNEPGALVNFRTPRLDLDSVYGSGPADQPYLYDWRCEHPGAKLLMTTDPDDCDLARLDLARNTQGRALIGDKRNDENAILSQLHLRFVRFHNALVDRLGADGSWSGSSLFEEARRIVRWHYQWIVVHDFLPKIVGTLMAAAVTPQLGNATAAGRRRLYPWRNVPAIPVEFSGAAYRFGHSMVRASYKLNDDSVTVPLFPVDYDRDNPVHLGGFRPLLDALEIEWDRFFFDPDDATGRENESMKMDEFIAQPLYKLPLRFTSGEVPGRAVPAVDLETAALPGLNMHRGVALGLPSGADVARALGHAPLDREQLFPASLELDEPSKAALEQATPLWYYLVREASVYGKEGVVGGTSKGFQLGPIGGRIVAEVLIGLLEADRRSYLNAQPAWKPGDGPAQRRLPAATTGDFTMLDLLSFTSGPSHA